MPGVRANNSTAANISTARAFRMKNKLKTRNLWDSIKLNKENYLMMAPYMILFTVFTIIPVFAAIVLSFTQFDLVQTPKWVGWENYVNLFLDDEVFLIAVRNTLVFSFITGPLSYFLSLMLAWFINDQKRWIRVLMTFLFYAPSISGNIFMVFGYMFSDNQYGLINSFLMRLGVLDEAIQWLTDPDYCLKVIIIAQLWMSLGAGFLAFIAGLQSIDRSLYEAGAIDGVKNRWQELWHITLPSMAPQLMFGAVMQIASSFAVSNIAIQLAGFPSTDYSARTIVTHVMDYGTQRFEMGYASAISAILFIVMILCKQVIGRLLKKFM